MQPRTILIAVYREASLRRSVDWNVSNDARIWSSAVFVADLRFTWVGKTKWWTRKRHARSGDVTDVLASTGWERFGRVDIASKRHHTILNHILNEDAVRFAHEIKQAVGQRMP